MNDNGDRLNDTYNFNDKSFDKQTQFDYDIYEYNLLNGRKCNYSEKLNFMQAPTCNCD